MKRSRSTSSAVVAAILLSSAVLFASGYTGPDPVTVGPWARANAYPTCVQRPTTTTGNELTGPINIYPIWYSNSTHPWTTTNKTYVRAALNSMGGSDYWKSSLSQYPDGFGNIPGATTVAAECDDPETEGTFCSCLGGGCWGIVENNISGGSGPCGLTADAHGVYVILPSWSDFSVSTPCHAGLANINSSGKTVQAVAVHYEPFAASEASFPLYYGAQWSTSAVFAQTSWTQVGIGSTTASITLNTIPTGLSVGWPIGIDNAGTSQVDYYTVASINTGSRTVTLTNNFSPVASGDASGATFNIGTGLQDMAGAMLPSLLYVASHEIIESVTNENANGWNCAATCSNAPFTICTTPGPSGCSSSGTCTSPFPEQGGGGESEIMDGCAIGAPSGYTYSATSTMPTWFGSGVSGNPAVWGTVVSGTQYDFVAQPIFQAFAGISAVGTTFGACANSFVPPPGGFCNSSADCSAPDGQWVQRCVSHVCVASTCTDGAKDGDESDTDCGGFCSMTWSATGGHPCPSTKVCRSGADCASGICTAGHCT